MGFGGGGVNVVEVVAQGSAQAFLGAGGVGCFLGGGEAGDDKSTEGVDLGHGFG